MKTVIALEGLGFGLPWAQSFYIQQELFPQIEAADVELFDFAWDNPAADSAISKVKSSDLCIVGHSFGGATVCDKGYEADLIVTIDPRVYGFGTFSVTNRAKRWLNFYERSFMFNLPGCPVVSTSGAVVGNTLVSGYSHTEMPSFPGIASAINDWIKS